MMIFIRLYSNSVGNVDRSSLFSNRSQQFTKRLENV